MLSQSTILVTGDVTIDWILARTSHAMRPPPDAGFADRIHLDQKLGGAVLSANLLGAILKKLDQPKTNPLRVINPATDSPRFPIPQSGQIQTYSIWSQFPSNGQKAWRVEKFLGIDDAVYVKDNTGSQTSQPTTVDFNQIALVVINDANLGFRQTNPDWITKLGNSQSAPWIILRTTQPVTQGALWETLLDQFADRLIVITSVDDLRKTEVQISEGLSWERTAQDVIWELIYNPRINSLAHCASTIVSFEGAGAVVLSRKSSISASQEEAHKFSSSLLFEPTITEGIWKRDHPEQIIGASQCLVAGVATQLLLNPAKPDILQGAQSGLSALQTLHKCGYENIGSLLQPELAFPIDQLVEDLIGNRKPFAQTEIEDPARYLQGTEGAAEKAPTDGYWSILRDRYRQNLDQVAVQIVIEGPEAVLTDVPLGVFGALLTVDRKEIESYNSIHSLVSEYISKSKQKRPLSFAVFGAPGSGKSFGVTQVAKSLAPGQIEVLEFNLSQFSSADELDTALHQVRDVNLSGDIPLVFWDEFDTTLSGTALGWLRHFLAPMQDGAFRQGELTYHIGRSIFVFAGGTSHRMESFGRGLKEEEYRAAKVPDFISRLKGYVNVLGPNQQRGDNDPYFILRRAILLRSILKRNSRNLLSKQDGREILHIDRGVLRAFLKTKQFKHGIRSMEAIGAMSKLSGKTTFERSSLPAATQLDLHVDGQEFLSLVHQLELSGELLEKLARAAHQVFCESLRQQDYHYGPKTDPVAKTHRALRPYDELNEDDKQQNIDTVRDIPNKLANSNYIMIPARSNEPAFEFPGTQLEALAKMEHERWMRLKRAAGWEVGPEIDTTKRQHPSLIPWENLPPEEKDKDETMIRSIPKILKIAGYTIVKLRD